MGNRFLIQSERKYSELMRPKIAAFYQALIEIFSDTPHFLLDGCQG
jgi:hypothetical protein